MKRKVMKSSLMLLIVVFWLITPKANAASDHLNDNSMRSVIPVVEIQGRQNANSNNESQFVENIQKNDYQLILSQDEKNWVKSHPVIFYSILNDETPLSFSSTTGTPAGLASDKLNELGQRIGVKFVGRLRNTQQELFDDIQQGKSTFIPYIYQLPQDRPDLLRLTIPYNRSLLVIVSRKAGPHFENMADLNGKVIALTSSPKRILLENGNVFKVSMSLQVKTSDALNLLTEGEVDAVVADFSLASYGNPPILNGGNK